MENVTGERNYKRSQYLVAKRFQLRYVGLILGLMFLTAILCSYVIYYTTMLLMGEKLANVYPQGRLVNIVKVVNFRIFLSMLFITPAVALLGIFLSHRIAGPLARMEKHLNRMAAGDFTARIFLRQGDELLELAKGINKVSDSVEATMKSQEEGLAKIVEMANAARKEPGNQSAGNIEEEARRLLSDISKFTEV